MTKNTSSIATLRLPRTTRRLQSDKPQLNKLHVQMLVRMKLRSECCGGKIVAWHHDKFYCDQCDGWLNRTHKS